MSIEEDAKGYIESLRGCCLSGMPKEYEVLEVPHFIESANDGPSGVVVLRIKRTEESDEKWAVVTDSQDYTGHG